MYKFAILLAFSLFLLESQARVKLTLLYESLCSDCKNLINNYFSDKVPALLPYVDIEYVVYGQGKHRRNRYGSYDFTCQHGDRECVGNKYHACAINASPDLLRTSRFVNCAMSAIYSQNYIGQLQTCANLNGLNWYAINNCANGQLGSNLLARNGDITHRFGRRLHFIPTILVNNQIIVDGNNDFSQFFSKMCRILNYAPSGC